MAVFIVVTWVQSSRAGHVAAAVRENELRVRVLGLQPYLVKLLIFVVSAVLVSIIAWCSCCCKAAPSRGPCLPTSRHPAGDGGPGRRRLALGAVIGGVFYNHPGPATHDAANSDTIDALPDILRVPLSEPLFILGTLFILVSSSCPAA